MADEILFDSDEAAEFDLIKRQEMDGDESPRLWRGLAWKIQAMPVYPDLISIPPPYTFWGGVSISFDSASKAMKDLAAAYDSMAVELFGEFASLNLRADTEPKKWAR